MKAMSWALAFAATQPRVDDGPASWRCWRTPSARSRSKRSSTAITTSWPARRTSRRTSSCTARARCGPRKARRSSSPDPWAHGPTSRAARDHWRRFAPAPMGRGEPCRVPRRASASRSTITPRPLQGIECRKDAEVLDETPAPTRTSMPSWRPRRPGRSGAYASSGGVREGIAPRRVGTVMGETRRPVKPWPLRCGGSSPPPPTSLLIKAMVTKSVHHCVNTGSRVEDSCGCRGIWRIRTCWQDVMKIL